MKKYQVFCKPCKDHPEGSLCYDTRNEAVESGLKEYYAIVTITFPEGME